MPIKSRGTIVRTVSEGPQRQAGRDITRERSVDEAIVEHEGGGVTAIDTWTALYCRYGEVVREITRPRGRNRRTGDAP